MPVEPGVRRQHPTRDMDMDTSSSSIALHALLDHSANFIPPVLLSFSLSHLFSHPTQPWSKTLGRLKTSFTFSTEYLLDRVCATRAGNSDAACAKPTIHVAFVDAARTDVVAQELKDITQALNDRRETDRFARDCRILFFDWKILGSFERGRDTPDIVRMRAFAGCLACNYSTKNKTVKHIWKLEEAIQGT